MGLTIAVCQFHEHKRLGPIRLVVEIHLSFGYVILPTYAWPITVCGGG
jgi:hypothetical protein